MALSDNDYRKLRLELKWWWWWRSSCGSHYMQTNSSDYSNLSDFTDDGGSYNDDGD